MKVSLVVASGAHQGKVIPITGPQFVVGRDPQCHLRPASQAVSKQHFAVLVRDGQVYLQDFGSTNGCVLNDAVVKGEERPLKNNDSLKIGPLDFTVRVEATAAREDGTPLPDMNPDAAAALAAVKAASATATKGSTRDATPAPKAPSKPAPGSKEAPALKSGSKEAPALAAGAKEATAAGESGGQEDHDRMAAMLLGLDDEEVPGGSTVVDVPSIGATGEPGAGGADPKTGEAPKPQATSSNAASELLRKYMRRPK